MVVVAAVVEQEGRYLLARRAPGQRHAGLWEFPGGKREAGETSEQALIREIQEELSLLIEVRDLLAVCRHAGLQLEAYRSRVLQGEARLCVHDRLEWVIPQQLRTYPMHGTDRQVVAALLAASR